MVRKTSAFAVVASGSGLLMALAAAICPPAMAQAPAGPITRAYSHIDDVRTYQRGLCKTVTISGDKDNAVIDWRCPAGPAGWPVTMFSADARDYVWFGRRAKRGASVMDALNGAFADPHSVIEWRLRNGEPYAAIHRYFFDGKQVLTVHRLNPDRTSCVAAVVAVERGHDANAEAARIADDIVPHFRCGDDELVVTGTTQPPS
jgi:hypothetical protein